MYTNMQVDKKDASFRNTSWFSKQRGTINEAQAKGLQFIGFRSLAAIVFGIAKKRDHSEQALSIRFPLSFV